MALLLVPGPAVAQQASQWAKVLHSQVRIVRGIMQPDGSIELGVHIELDDGWKTYWRVPGDAGVPPEFDWARSSNVKDVSVAWPAPIRFRDQFGESIGYMDEVLFPVTVTPEDWTRATYVELTVNFAVCKDICAPVQANLSLPLMAQSSSPRFAGLIARYKQTVPKPPEQVPGLRVAHVEVVHSGDDVHLLVDIKCDDTARPMDVFVEGDQRLFFATPKLETGAPEGHKRFRIRVDSATDDKSLAGERLNFVVVEGQKRLAQSWHLQ